MRQLLTFFATVVYIMAHFFQIKIIFFASNAFVVLLILEIILKMGRHAFSKNFITIPL